MENCIFCETLSKVKSQNADRGITTDKYFVKLVRKCYRNTLIQSTYMSSSLNINYCPVCGKRLKEVNKMPDKENQQEQEQELEVVQEVAGIESIPGAVKNNNQ